jgi:hypothetical protein
VEEIIYQYGWHLVAFLDVCGQREELRQLRMPKTEDEYLAVLGILKNTAGVVLGLRKVFSDYFKSFAQGYPNLIVPNFRGVSDSFIVSVPLKDNDANVTLVRSYCALSAAAAVMLSSLARSHALRGGIDLGVGVEISQGEIYGAASERVYALENRDAKYPRILIGDADGRSILDYLGPGIANCPMPKYADDVVKPAYQFVVEKHEYFLSIGDRKLSERYANLRRYFELRLPMWGLAATRPGVRAEAPLPSFLL